MIKSLEKCAWWVIRKYGINNLLFPFRMCVSAKSLQLCPTPCDRLDCSLLGSSVHRIFQARILEWVAMPSSRASSQPRDWTPVSCLLYWQVGSLPPRPPGKPWLQDMQVLKGNWSVNSSFWKKGTSFEITFQVLWKSLKLVACYSGNNWKIIMFLCLPTPTLNFIRGGKNIDGTGQKMNTGANKWEKGDFVINLSMNVQRSEIEWKLQKEWLTEVREI